MVPPLKEAVEEAFTAGLVKVVYATETLALGVNMPARTVVIEKLTKFTGERHEFLTPGEYTQLTGRAGRRGIDETGYAVVLWSPFVTFDQVAAAGGTGLRSTRVRLSSHVQHGRQPGLPLRPGDGPSAVEPFLCPVSCRSRCGGTGTRAHRARGRLERARGARSASGDATPAPRPPSRPPAIERAIDRLEPGDVVLMGRRRVAHGGHRPRGAVRVGAEYLPSTRAATFAVSVPTTSPFRRCPSRASSCRSRTRRAAPHFVAWSRKQVGGSASRPVRRLPTPANRDPASERARDRQSANAVAVESRRA